jgi:hypothetical protein
VDRAATAAADAGKLSTFLGADVDKKLKQAQKRADRFSSNEESVSSFAGFIRFWWKT